MSGHGETTVIIDYGSGNLHSAEKSVQRMAGPLGQRVLVTSEPELVRAADRVFLPGVGAFGDCAAGLRGVEGMVEALTELVIERGRPFIGVCVGMQLMADFGVERGRYDGLGWIAGHVEKITPHDPATKIPHMGWNQLEIRRPDHPVLMDLPEPAYAYFVHSYHMKTDDPGLTLATVSYDGEITAIIGRDNLIGTQFHPEKSQKVGLALIENFLRWRP